MTKSQISSSNDNKIKSILEGFLHGTISLSELASELKSLVLIDFSEAPGKRSIKNISLSADVIVHVRTEDVCCMLSKYISGDISGMELSNWSALVFLLPNYIPEGSTKEDRYADAQGPTWDILEYLTAPIFDGEVDITKAKRYLAVLSCKS